MNASNSTLVNRLILLVLCLNFVCLVLLLARTYRKPTDSGAAAAPPPTESAAAQLETPANTTEPPAQRVPVRRNSGLVARTSSVDVPAQESALLRMPVPVEAIPAPAAPVTPPVLVNLPAGRSVQPTPAGATSDGLPRLAGRVFLKGVPPPELPIHMDSICSGLNPGETMTTRHFVVGADGGLANVLVWVRNAPPSRALTSTPVTVLEQVNCRYEPYVLGVVTGQTFAIRNLDPVLHNIHATPKLNREFNFGQGAQGQMNSVAFEKPELFIRLKCDVHPWEFAYVSVFEHPYFSITDTNGYFQIPPGLLPGRYVVAAAHLKTGGARVLAEQTVEVHHGEQRVLTLEFELAPPRTQAVSR